MFQSTAKPLHITAVGDEFTGKSSLLATYLTKEFPEEMNYNKKLYFHGRCHMILNKEEFYLIVKPAPGEDYFDESREVWYKNTDCFIICYSISSSISLSRVQDKWLADIRRFDKSTPVILVGTMTDLRDTEPIDTLISKKEGAHVAQTIQADGFVECSALNMDNVDTVFEEAVKAIFVKTNDYEYIPDFEEVELKQQEKKENSSMQIQESTPKTQDQVEKESGKNGKVKRNKKKDTDDNKISFDNKEIETKTQEQLAKESEKNGRVKIPKVKEIIAVEDNTSSTTIITEKKHEAEVSVPVSGENKKVELSEGNVSTKQGTVDENDAMKEADGDVDDNLKTSEDNLSKNELSTRIGKLIQKFETRCDVTSK